MGKLTAGLLACALTTTLVACGDGGDDDETAAATTESVDAEALCGIRTSEEADPEVILALVEEAEAADAPAAIGEASEVYLWAVRESAEHETIEPLLLTPVMAASAEVDGWCNDQGELRATSRAPWTVSGLDIESMSEQVNTKVLGDAPAMSMGSLFQATSQALGQQALTGMAATSGSWQPTRVPDVVMLYSIDTASDGVGTQQIYGG